MPANMPANLTALKNQISQSGAWVWLLTVALPRGGPTLRFVSNTEDVTYGGETYTAFNFTIDGFSYNASGEIPELTMVVTNVGCVLQEHIRNYNGLIGGTVSYVQVNTDYLAEDYSEDQTALTITNAQNAWPDLQLTLSVPPALRYRVPESRFNCYCCPHTFRAPSGEYTSRCGYAGKAIVAVTLSAGNPVSVQVTSHGFVTGDTVRIYSITGITGGLAGDYIVTRTAANTFTLDGTSGSSFGGAFASGRAGYAACGRTPAECSRRGRFPTSYGSPLSMRREAVRYA